MMERPDEFNKILEKAIRYHMQDFRVHGLGQKNVNRIKAFFSQKSVNPDDKYIFQKKYEKVVPAYVIEYVVTIIGV